MGYSRMKEATAEDHEVDEKIKGVFGQEISLGWKTSSLAKRPLSPCFSNSPNKSPNKRCPPEETKYILMVKPLILIRRVPFRGNDLGSLNRYSYNNNIGQCMNNMICHLSVLHLRLSHILHELVGVRSLMQLADAPHALMDFREGCRRVDQVEDET